MPVIRVDQQNPETVPKWSEVHYYGINYLKKGDEVEPHFHDCNEYWVIVSGRGICTTEGDTYEISTGDLVLTKKGDKHSMTVKEDMIAVYLYGIMEPGARIGHLHDDDD